MGSMAMDGDLGPLQRAMGHIREAFGIGGVAGLPAPCRDINIAIVVGGLGTTHFPRRPTLLSLMCPWGCSSRNTSLSDGYLIHKGIPVPVSYLRKRREQSRSSSSMHRSRTPIVPLGVRGLHAGGLALAVGLAERGIEAHVFESAASLRTDSGTIVGTNNNGEACTWFQSLGFR